MENSTDMSNKLNATHKSLISTATEFGTLVQKIEVWFKELDEKERRLHLKERELEEREKKLQEREQEIRKKEQQTWNQSNINYVNDDKFSLTVDNNLESKQFSFEEEDDISFEEEEDDISFYSATSTSTNNISSEQLVPVLHPHILKWLPKRTFSLLYKATRDGFNNDGFRNLCEHKGPTISIIESDKGFLFGGYTPISWGKMNLKGQKRDDINPDFFLFTLTNPHNIPPQQYFLKDPNDIRAVRNVWHVAFGSGWDLYVARFNANLENNSICGLGKRDSSYEDTTKKGNKTFTGSEFFRVKEIEVYLVT